MVVGAELARAGGRDAAVDRRARLGLDAERARHAEMHDERPCRRRGRRARYFARRPTRDDLPPGEPLGEAAREGHAQVGAALLDLDDRRALHHRREAAADGFDFGKFGHMYGANPLARRATIACVGTAWAMVRADPEHGHDRQARARAHGPAAATRASFGFREVADSPTSRAWSTTSSTRSRARYDLMNDLMSGGLHRALEGRDGRLAGAAAQPPPCPITCSTLPAAPATSPSGSPSARTAPSSPSPTSTARCWRSAASAPAQRRLRRPRRPSSRPMPRTCRSTTAASMP